MVLRQGKSFYNNHKGFFCRGRSWFMLCPRKRGGGKSCSLGTFLIINCILHVARFPERATASAQLPFAVRQSEQHCRRTTKKTFPIRKSVSGKDLQPAQPPGSRELSGTTTPTTIVGPTATRGRSVQTSSLHPKEESVRVRTANDIHSVQSVAGGGHGPLVARLNSFARLPHFFS